MSIASYADLKDAVATWLKREDDAQIAALVPDFIRMGELRIYRKLRIRAMETALSETIASGVIAVPSGYVALKFASVSSSVPTKLERKDAEWIHYNYPNRSSGGIPKFIAREGENFIFGPYPDSTYTVSGIYYKRLTALSDSNTSNWFTENAPDLLLFASLCEAAAYAEDEMTKLWEGKFSHLSDEVQREDDNEEFSGGPLWTTNR